MREITDHYDGHGLNESITISTDAPDARGAAHRYELWLNGDYVGFMQFQKGPDPASTAGATEAAVTAVLIDRLRGFQAGPYACQENAEQLAHLQEVLRLTKARADERARRGVLGVNAK